MRLILILSFLCVSTLSYSVETLNFRQLKGLNPHLAKEAAVQLKQRELGSFHGKQTQIRGFLYEKSDHTWILAPEPNLRSCCISSPDKISQQIYLGSLPGTPPTLRAVTIQGIFSVEPQWDSDGNMIHLYKLDEINIEENLTWDWPTIVLILVGLLATLLMSILWHHSYRKNDYSVKMQNG